MDLNLAGRVALITGGSQGIGRAVAIQLGREGARVALTYRHERAKAEEVVSTIEGAGGEAICVPMDLEALETVRDAAVAATKRWGSVDVLVNNAVLWGDRKPWDMPLFEDVPQAEWQRVFRANFEGAYAAIQAVLPSMRARNWGRIVNISSGVALDGVSGGSPYGAAKAGLHGLTNTLARELGPMGVLINVVVPGATLTEHMTEALPPAIREQREKAYPIRRLLPPEEVAPTIVFLCSALNTAVTGEVIRASGGRPS